jgi:hypothetical protein
MFPSFPRFAAAVVVACAAVGCASILGSEWRRVPGTLDQHLNAGGSLQAPAEVSRGVAFEVVVTTYGSGSCTRPAGAEVRMEGMLAVVRPFDLSREGRATCTADLAAFPRPVSLRFDAAGEAAIRVVGAAGTVVEQGVTVRP